MNRIPLACQLYSVHRSLAKDLEGTIEQVAAIGYEGVEFYSGVEKDAERINAILQKTGLKVCGWHSAWDDFTPENIEKTIAFHKAIGNTCVVVPGLPAEMTKDGEAWLHTAQLMNEVQKKLSAEGIHLGYHNHDAEFKPVLGEDDAWDVMAKNTGDDFILQLDNGNAMSGGADPLALLKKYPKRAYTIHLKPYSLKDGFDTMVGEDDIDWKATFAEIEKQDATKWYIMEYESEKCYESDIEGVRVCYQKLKMLGL